jgi:hypothetical protein
MAKAKQRNNLQLIEYVGLILAAWFTYSVIKNAQDVIANAIQNAPASYALIASALIVCWTTFKNNNRLTRIGLVTLAVLITSGSVWLFGLHS